MTPKLFEVLRLACVLIAAAVIGNWFTLELKKARTAGKPLYAAYLTVPGILIILAVLVIPVVVWMAKN
jgi:hypothetical protein